jgi:hypothetical protein
MTADRRLRPWQQLSEREQSVWGAAYARSSKFGVEAAFDADRVVQSLADIEWPEREAPEHRAARLVHGLEPEEFAAWYRVEVKLNASGRRYVPASDADIDKAYEIYLRCGSDFY